MSELYTKPYLWRQLPGTPECDLSPIDFARLFSYGISVSANLIAILAHYGLFCALPYIRIMVSIKLEIESLGTFS